MSLTAAHCAKTLIMASVSGSSALRQCTKFLLPGMIECLAKMAAVSEEEAASEQRIATVAEVYKAFSALFTNIPDESRKPHPSLYCTSRTHPWTSYRCTIAGRFHAGDHFVLGSIAFTADDNAFSECDAPPLTCSCFSISI